MGNILQMSETKWQDLREDILKQEGWFVPTLHIKFAQPEDARNKFLKGRCSKWLAENFGINAEIGRIEVLEQEDIDKNLGIVGIKFTFSNKDGVEGDSVAFVDAAEVRDVV